ncbi:DUF2971 domain-containing protein [Sporomusa aerivorans]|uniref:DUF2971 domain-containing protein n=1 Tax=Sporomusa aerivorans TaxID=204936 RepID=UPI00352AAD60
MKYLYKYMPLRKEFFDNLMIRATPFAALNDPYEGLYNDEQFKTANKGVQKFAKKQGIPVEDVSDNFLNGVMDFIQLDFDAVGVLSFTEDYTSSLMWAHYADQHRGIVLEFDYDKPLFQDSTRKLGKRESRFGENYLGGFYEFPEKVMYRREILSFERYEQVQVNGEYPFREFLHDLFFTKSNDWLYEKEWRSIVQLSDADSIICRKNELLSKTLAKDKTIKVKNPDQDKIQIIYPSGYEMHEDMGDQSLKQEIALQIFSENANNINLFRLNPEAISRIYCGHRCDEDQVKKFVHSNSQLTHLKDNIYKMEIDRYSYQLNSNLVK